MAVPSSAINIVVTCTARKTKSVPNWARMAGVSGRTTGSRLAEWVRRFESKQLEKVKAVDLYCGSAWAPVKKLYLHPGAGARERIWIISAGQGLLSPEMEIGSYSATFSAGQPDSVIPRSLDAHEVANWWGGLIGWRRSSGNPIASIADIAKTHPDDPLLIALSDDYLSAVEPDIIAARKVLSDQDRLVIISSGAAKRGPLSNSFLPCDSRFENLLGRGRVALNTRLLAAVLRKHRKEDLRISTLRPLYEAMLKKLPDASYPKRRISTDDEVRRFIGSELNRDRKATHSRLLRAYRATGQACEQSRFRNLFQELKAGCKSKGG